MAKQKLVNPDKIIHVPLSVDEMAIRFLRYSFGPINYDYDRLTRHEKALVTKEDFERLVKFIMTGVPS